MSRYTDFYELLAANFPRQMAIDQALREFPTKLKNAIRGYLGAPEGPSQQATL